MFFNTLTGKGGVLSVLVLLNTLLFKYFRNTFDIWQLFHVEWTLWVTCRVNWASYFHLITLKFEFRLSQNRKTKENRIENPSVIRKQLRTCSILHLSYNTTQFGGRYTVKLPLQYKRFIINIILALLLLFFTVIDFCNIFLFQTTFTPSFGINDCHCGNECNITLHAYTNTYIHTNIGSYIFVWDIRTLIYTYICAEVND